MIPTYTSETLHLDAQIQILKEQDRASLPKFPVSSITRELRNRGWIYVAGKFSMDFNPNHLMTHDEILDEIKIGMLSTRSYVGDNLSIGMDTIARSLTKNVVEGSWSERVES